MTTIRRPYLLFLALLVAACGARAPDGRSAGRAAPVPPTPPLLVTHAAAHHTCALDAYGIAVCWGRNDRGQLGNGEAGEATVARVRVAAQRPLAMVTVGGHTCALDHGGIALCWGANDRGQLGVGGTADRATPRPVLTDRRFGRIAAGAAHTCALQPDGRAFCWGDNRWGQLGDGTRTDAMTPVAVDTDASFTRLAAGGRHTCGIAARGQVLCWGDNFLGQLALPRARQVSLEPVAVPGLPAVRAISAGHGHTCAIAQDGAGWCWGQNGIGQLGSGAPPGAYGPVRVAGAPPLAELRVGYHHTCAVDTDGNGWCWGANTSSEPGDARTTGQLGSEASWSNLPLRIALDRPLDVIAPGDGHTCGLTRAGVIYCFGSNRFGQLARDDLARSLEPIRVLRVEPNPVEMRP